MTGSDDGLVHVTKDGGKNWTNVTPKKMPEWMMINCIEIDPVTKGGAYVVGTKYKSVITCLISIKQKITEKLGGKLPMELVLKILHAPEGRSKT